MNKTKIEWVKNPDGTQGGYTWNPITGCLNHNNGLCKGGGFPCYAYKLAHGRLKQRYLANLYWIGHYAGYTDSNIESFHLGKNDPFYPRFWEERLTDPLSCLKDELNYYPQRPKGIFVCDMGELFSDWIPSIWQERVFDAIKCHSQHRFYLLTKQPQNLIKFSFPDNCWVGVTATNEEAMQKASYLDDIWAKVKFISFEPLLGRLSKVSLFNIRQNIADWLIIGACTGTKTEMSELVREYPDLTLMPYGRKWTAQSRIEWVEEIVRAADKAGVPVFLKDNLMPLFEDGGITKREDWTGIRQEMPV